MLDGVVCFHNADERKHGPVLDELKAPAAKRINPSRLSFRACTSSTVTSLPVFNLVCASLWSVVRGGISREVLVALYSNVGRNL